VWWLAGATFINSLGAMVFPFLLLYFHRSLKLDLELAGGMVACWGFGSFLAGPLGGWAADRFDCVRLLTFSLASAGALMVTFPLWENASALMVVTFCLALLADLSRPGSLTALARLAGAEHSRDAFSLNYLAINLGMSIGPTLGGYLAEHDYRYLFWVDGGTSLLGAALLLFSGVRCPPAPRSVDAAVDWNVGPRAFAMLAWLALTFWVFMTFFAASPLYAVEELGLKEHDCGLIWLLNTVVIVCTTMSLTRRTEGWNLGRLLASAALGIALCYLTLWVLPNLTGLVLATLWLTFGEMLLFSNANAYLSAVVPPQKLGRAMGWNAMCVSLSLTLSSPTIGYFFAHRTPGELWLLMAAAACLAAWGFARLPDPR
jgi:predicted MFS family arabinose efflux permease